MSVKDPEQREPLSLGIVRELLQRPRLVFLLPLVVAIIAGGMVSIVGTRYKATSILQPDLQTPETGMASLAGQLGFALPGGGESLAFYTTLVQSRQVLSMVLAKLEGGDQRRMAERQKVIEEIEELRDRITVRADQAAGLIEVTTLGATPQDAETLNRLLIASVEDYNSMRRRSRAVAEQEFVEEGARRAQDSLIAAENRLQQFLEANRSFQSAELVFENARLERRVQLAQMIYSSLAQAAEEARIEAVRNTPVINVVDPPEGSAVPRATALVVGLVTWFLATGLVLLLLSLKMYRDYVRREFPLAYQEIRSTVRPWRK